MITLHPKAGRLAGVRIISPVTDEELIAFVPQMVKWVRSIVGQVVFCHDVRGTIVLTETISSRVIDLMRHDNPRLKRAALLLPTGSAVLALQFERIIREAGNPARRTFRRAAEAQEWLSEVLVPAEQEGLAQFLAEGSDAEREGAAPPSSALSVPVPSRAEPSRRDRPSRSSRND
jgi:hypothetical protein